MIREINPLLKTQVKDFQHVNRLDFREDLPRGSMKRLHSVIADLLAAAGKGRSVMAQGYSQNDFFLWLTDGEHTNLKVLISTLKTSVNQQLTLRY
jgi:hypothetical protein